MDNINEVERGNSLDLYETESSDFPQVSHDSRTQEAPTEDIENSVGTTLHTVNTPNTDLPREIPCESKFIRSNNVGARIGVFSEALENLKNYQDVDDRINDKQSMEVEIDSVSETLSDKMAQLDSLLKTESTENLELSSSEGKESSRNHIKKLLNLSETFTDSSHSSSSEPQSSAAPFESSSSSQENNANTNRVDFENSIESQMMWKERESLRASTTDIKMEVESSSVAEEDTKKNTFPSDSVSIIKAEENSQLSVPTEQVVSNGIDNACSLAPEFPPSIPLDQSESKDSQSEVKIESEQQPSTDQAPVPVVPPAPRKRGRPRKQVLPNPSPLVESWGPNAQEFPSLEPPKEELKRSSRSERRLAKKKKLEEVEDVDENSKKRKAPQVYQKKKRRSTYVPKKRLPPAKKKQPEVENFQNFEEETRMSASEAPAAFPTKTAVAAAAAATPAGDESQGSSATDGPTRSNINKKGRMEVASDGCKPVTVQQIVEYHWPPPSAQNEKAEALMIQEQITEYLGVKSFKRKYPSIKRRPVDMEERNYLQENGFVSENMCDLGLTAVFAADIIEIMYNDFPQKFDEYRKYTREKKAKEQRALREKQAAERADMDPKKEAMESAHSWNSDFNKTRRFKVLHPDQKMWVLLDGMPCPASDKMILYHASDNVSLCVEDDIWDMTLFSYECEISAETRLDRSKNFMPQNQWKFVVAVVSV